MTRRGRLGVVPILVVAAVLYLWTLAEQGTANPYYAAAAQSGGESWAAWFFGSLDAGGAITVDKPPFSLWLMGFSVRIFGFSSWSLLVPQALLGVATIAVLYAAVRRSSGQVPALIAAAVLAVMPVATLMFRYNNPDAALALLLTLAAYLSLRVADAAAADRWPAARRWAVAVGVIVGLAFLTKTLQAILVVPALLLFLIIAVPGTRAERARLGVLAAAGFVVASSWWIAVVELWPASDRPYIGGSQNNSVLGLLFGLNGATRLTGGGEGPFGTGSSPFAAPPGPLRMFTEPFAGQIAWVLPLAVICGAIGLWIHRRESSRIRNAYLLWAVWAAVHLAAFSFAAGVIHSYYALAAAPALAALVGMGATDLARSSRRAGFARVITVALLLTGAVSVVQLRRSPDFLPWLGPVVALCAVGASAVVLLRSRRVRIDSAGEGHATVVTGGTIAAGLAAVAVLAGPVAWSVATASAMQSGGNPISGPARPTSDIATPADQVLAAFVRGRFDVEASLGRTWGAAAVGAEVAAPLQLAAGVPVITLGGFDGLDPGPNMRNVQTWVDEGRLNYIVDGTAGFRDGLGAEDAVATAVIAWARTHGTAVTIPGSPATVYALAPE